MVMMKGKPRMLASIRIYQSYREDRTLRRENCCVRERDQTVERE